MTIRDPSTVRNISATPANAPADVEDLRLQRLTSREGQQLPGELGGSIGGFRDGFQVPRAPLLRHVAPSQQVGGREDDRQQVVEVVRHTACQLADGFHLLRLAQRLFRFATRGDVDGFRYDRDHLAVIVAHRPASGNRTIASRWTAGECGSPCVESRLSPRRGSRRERIPACRAYR